MSKLQVRPLCFRLSATLIAMACAPILCATENVPHAPFGQWANAPEHGQLVIGLTYQESEAYHIWAGDDMHKVDWRKAGEHYGIDINQGWLSLQYGITKRWAADLAVGYTTSGWRYFANESTNGAAQSTSGLMDFALGIRYQFFKEGEGDCAWTPTLTFRAGAVLPGSFDKDFPFAPGTRSAAIEPELILRKHFGWPGLGLYADGLFRWNRTTANDQYIVSAGLFQQIKGWELNVGYRRLGSVDGDDIVYDPDTRLIEYPRGVRESNDAVEAGFSYTLPKRQVRLAFYTRTVITGENSDKKFWIGATVEMPFSLFKPQ